MRKTLFFLTVIMLPVITAFAQGGTTGPLTWNFSGGTLTISGTGNMPDYAFGETPWSWCSSLIHTVVIGNGVLSIGHEAFYNCSSLNTITIPNTVKTIGGYIFFGCSSLITVSIPSSVTKLGGLIYPPDSPFHGCSSLNSINVASENNTYASEGGVLFDKTKTQLICYPEGKADDYVVPIGVTSIGNSAFESCINLTSITISNGVTTIGTSAFRNCSNLNTITIHESVTNIYSEAFIYCSNLISVTNFNPNPVYINSNVFHNSNQSACTLRVPTSSISAYQSAPVWQNFYPILGIDIVEKPTITTTTPLPDGTIGAAYSQTFAATGTAPIIWTKTGGNLPTGLILSAEGVISGTPITKGTFDFTVKAINNAGTDTKLLTITVIDTVEISLHWDYSYPQPTIKPKGVAADGVARLLVKIKDDNMKSISTSLSTNGYPDNSTTANMLGKLYKVTDQYSDEANNATATSINITQIENGKVWLWYVAPDDFVEFTGPSDYANRSMRIVNLNIKIRYENDSIEKTVPIEIVRPPLMLVHGLNSNPDCWENFHYGNTYGEWFINSSLFKQKRAIDLNPGGSFEKNANVLLDWVFHNNSSFTYNIDALREQGYASNQVDYVCHSMGGCVLRKAIENNNLYYSKYNYKKGFVNKAITINTPHNGSPLANFVVEHPFTNTIFKFIDIFRPMGGLINPFGGTTDAVRNLQMGNNGVRFETTYVKNHNIAGNINMDNLPTTKIPSYIKFINYNWAERMRLIENTAQGAYYYFNDYFQQKGVANFFGAGDGVVSLSSQLAQTEGQHNPFNHNKIFSTGSTDLDVFHTSIVDQENVGRWVMDLLNTSVHRNEFSDAIPADNNPIIAKSTEKSDLVLKTVIKVFDNSHIEIISPNCNIDFGVNDSLSFSFQIKDTSSLMFIDYLFQDHYGISLSKSETQTIGFSVSPDFLDRQTIYVVANYDIGDITMCYIDTISLNVVTNESLTDFKINPKTANIYEAQYYYPQMQATYETFVSNVPCNSNKLTIHINDASIVNYDPNYYCFIGKNEGNTFAIISYENLWDTIFFNVMLLPDSIPLGITEFKQPKLFSNSVLNINVYPNPTNNTITVVFDYSIKGTIVLYDMFGKTVFTQDIASDKAMINMGNLSNGTYILRAVTNDKIMGSKKIIKQ